MRADPERKLDREIALLRARLEIAEEMRRAIVDDEVDGFVVGKNGGEPKLVLLETARPGHDLLLERMHQGAVTVALGGGILYANERFAAMVGRPLAQLFSARIRDFVAPSDRTRLDAFLATAAPDTSIDVVIEGSDASFVARITAVALGEGHASLLVTDLSAGERLAEAENAVKAIRNGEIDGIVVAGDHVMLIGDAHRPYRALADRIEQGAATVSAQGDLLYVNDRFAAMVGIARNHLLGQSVLPLLEGDADVAREFLAGAARGSSPRELSIVRADGTRLPVGIAAQRVEGTEAVTLVVTDLTEQKRHQAIEEEAARKDRFLAVLAHELRNPLASIRNATEVLQRSSQLGDDERYSVQLIGRQTATLVRLVDDLLDIHRLNQGKIVLRRQPIDLCGVVRHAVEAAQPYVASKQHVLDMSLPDEPVFVDADPVRLAQVLLNLLSNAAKFTSEGGRITISLERANSASGSAVARVRVRDNGIGVPAELLDLIFDPYVQAASDDTASGGLGLGLSVARRLIQLHGGTIRAQSAGPGRGTTFTIELAICPAPEQVAASPAVAVAVEDEAPKRALRILVADDSEDNAHSLAMVLRLAGHDTRIANDGAQAIVVAEEFRPHIAVLDIDMPGMDGYETARALRERQWASDLVLYALTGWGQAEDRKRAREAGFDSHFVKPVAPDVLARAIDSHSAPKQSS